MALVDAPLSQADAWRMIRLGLSRPEITRFA
jgi:hypothetical protein